MGLPEPSLEGASLVSDCGGSKSRVGGERLLAVMRITEIQFCPPRLLFMTDRKFLIAQIHVMKSGQ